MTVHMTADTTDGASDEKKPVSADETEGGGVMPVATAGAESVSIREDGDVGALQPPQEPGSGLPFSKARCVALVGTVTGASFLNVSLQRETALPQCAFG